MSGDIKSRAPYYDNYDSHEKGQHYTHMLAVPGRVAQARELTQIQSVVKDIIKNIGDSVWQNGDVIEGCQVAVNLTDKVVNVSEGRVYLEGIVYTVSETILDIDAEGTETIGFILEETLITEEDDPSLRDPALGFDNYNQAGCHRIKSEIKIVKDDPNAALLVTLNDGVVRVENNTGEYSVLNQTLADRTYEESGSYIVEGLKVRVKPNTEDSDNKFDIVVDKGIAYVRGHRVSTNTIIKTIDKSLTPTILISDVPIRSYSRDDQSTVHELFDKPYISSIEALKGTVSVSDRVLSVFAPDATHSYPYSRIDGVGVYIRSVEGNYSYNISTGSTQSTILWTGTSTPSEEVKISYDYRHTYDPKYYTLYDNRGVEINIAEMKSDGIEPIDLLLDYHQYPARNDIVYIDKYGSIEVETGVPAEYGFETTPRAPSDALSLATIMSPPGGSASTNSNNKILVSNVGLTRFTMNDIHRILNRLKTVEYDQAILALNEDAKYYYTSNNKSGILTDPLIDLSRISLLYDREGYKHSAAIDLLNNLCYLSINTNSYDAKYSAKSTTHIYQKYITLNTTGMDRSILSQPRATRAFPINPYSVFPQYPEISINPAIDSWISDTFDDISISTNNSEVVSSTTNLLDVYNTSGARAASVTNSSYVDTAIGTRTTNSTSTSILSETASTYMRSRIIDVVGSLFPAGHPEQKLTCYLDGQRMKWIDDSDNEIEVSPDDTGKFSGKFKIPENAILTGSKEVRVVSSLINNINFRESETVATTIYQATGIDRMIQRTTTTLTTILLERVTTETTTHYIDPVGQTFVLSRTSLIKGINLYFTQKNSNIPVTCEIREVVNGSITSTVYGQKTLFPKDVNVPEILENGTISELLPTRFDFDDPVLIEANRIYAFVVRSTANDYKLWVAELGELDYFTGNPVLSNPYLVGLMMSSSNNNSWTNHQTTDITFDLIEDVYENSSVVEFDLQNVSEFSRVYLLADSITPNGTSIKWEYSVGEDYKSISPYEIRVLGSMYSSLSLRAHLSNISGMNLSPIILKDSVTTVLSSFNTGEPSMYVSELVQQLDPYTHVDVVLDTYIPENTSMRIVVATEDSKNGSVTYKEAVESDNYKYLELDWYERVYSIDVSHPDTPEDEKPTTCRIIIIMESNAVTNQNTGRISNITPAFRRMRAIMS